MRRDHGYGRDHHGRGWSGMEGRHWKRNRGKLFLRFLFFFGFVVMLILGGMGALALLLTRSLGGSREIAGLVWVLGCGLALALPILAMGLASRAFRGIATPLADVMAAADAVAEGDLTVRVPERGGKNQFSGLVRSFNRMTAELEQSDRLRRNLTADVAHELRTPLHILQGNLEGILDGVYDPTDEHIANTLEESKTLSRLVDDLQLLSQAEAGQLELVKSEVDVSDLLADIYTSFSGIAAEKGVELSVDGVPKAGKVVIIADPLRLDQVFSNLVVNALRYTPTGGFVRLSASVQDDEVQIVVADSGIGIAPEDLEHVFDRFWRADAARTHSKGAGAGLGLAIASQLVEAHHGTISVASELGEGTQFTVILPVS